MTSPIATVLILTAVLAGGCSGRSPDPRAGAPVAGPHGGRSFALPDGSGSVESLLETDSGAPLPAPKAGAKVSRVKSVIAAYFLGPDGASAMQRVPSNVRLRLRADDRRYKEVELKPRPRAGDPAGAGRYVSPPDAYAPELLRATVVVTVAGRDVEIPVVVR